MSLAAGDTPTSRRLLVEMTTAEQTEYLEGIRKQRLVAVVKHQELVAAKKLVKDEKLAARITKEEGLLQKDIERVDAVLEKLQERLAKASALIAMQRSEV